MRNVLTLNVMLVKLSLGDLKGNSSLPDDNSSVHLSWDIHTKFPYFMLMNGGHCNHNLLSNHLSEC
jgi:hypothetical protein